MYSIPYKKMLINFVGMRTQYTISLIFSSSRLIDKMSPELIILFKD